MKILFLVLFMPGLVMATDVELGIGQSRYTLQSDGTWYQLANPHVIDKRSVAFQAGVTGDFNPWLGWHMDYVNLGHLSASCECATIDSQYDFVNHRMKVPAPYPTARYVGSGVADGIKLSLTPHAYVGSWDVGFEAGLFPYRPGWHESVYGWSTSLDGPFVNGSHNTPKAIQLGGVVGIFVKRDHFTVSLESYRLPTRFDASHNPALWTRADVLMLSYNF